MRPEAEPVVLDPGSSRTLSIAGVALRIECRPGKASLVLPKAYLPFEATGNDAPDVCLSVATKEELSSQKGPLLYAARHWRLRWPGDAFGFEVFYPPTSELYCRMEADAELSRLELSFGRRNLERLPREFREPSRERLWVPHPFEQIALIPALARRGGFLVHAAGAIVGGKALVFAGHSGDGKTTLARLLAAEGVELLSDERIAIRDRGDGTFDAYGTPWAGEGEVVSTRSAPLGGIFLLRKSAAHRLVLEPCGSLVAELLARCLVPYYLEGNVARIVSLVTRAALSRPLGIVELALEGGLKAVLERFVRGEAPSRQPRQPLSA